MEIVAIIPARGGSKGLVNKNRVFLKGKPLIAYSIEAAQQSGIIKRIIVSTDDEEIAAVARKRGAEVPFIRPKELSQDSTPTLPVLKHTIQWLRENENYDPEIVICLFPTYPLRSTEDIENTIKKLVETNAESACTICEVEENPCWATRLENDRTFFDEMSMMINKGKKMIQSRQELPKFYRFGNTAAVKTDVLMKLNHHYLSKDNRAVVVEKRRCLDIHTPIDIKIAEVLMDE